MSSAKIKHEELRRLEALRLALGCPGIVGATATEIVAIAKVFADWLGSGSQPNAKEEDNGEA